MLKAPLLLCLLLAQSRLCVDLTSFWWYNQDLEYVLVNTNQQENVIFLTDVTRDASDQFRMYSHHMVKSKANVYSVSMRNHGQSFRSGRMTTAELAKDVVKFINTHKIRNVHLVGLYTGARVAMHIAFHYPRLIKSLGVFETMPFAINPDLNAGFIEDLRRIRDMDLRGKTLEEIIAEIREFSPDATELERYFVYEDGEYKLGLDLEYLLSSGYFEEEAREMPAATYAGPTRFVFQFPYSFYSESDIPNLVNYFPNLDTVADIRIVPVEEGDYTQNLPLLVELFRWLTHL